MVKCSRSISLEHLMVFLKGDSQYTLLGFPLNFRKMDPTLHCVDCLTEQFPLLFFIFLLNIPG